MGDAKAVILKNVFDTIAHLLKESFYYNHFLAS